ncbi:MAG: hypothetical protein A3F83_13085 [Candidatus Glassbacteria bacterium RIFCSPLOWO2_12_FULL_58_11]|uniref:HTH marR-type domain-containing protein n=2 Tax=Candidatus Glassiibacteriota TaxID=1817805 RepID=A0A1F5Z301_9BACT|nr:MAG: hypothetical protein A2Z86_03580 [Candidatus Glassbacteria bacterium GWA2_58_10]OGG06547.1 MAG: hypothetical protein A3F83_13085 [Candidatus Glassbacteria bacterium RIFCSPLOWO2_12_FULL_58_11]
MDALKILSPIHKATRQIGLHLEQKTRRLGVSNIEGHLLTYLLSYAPCPIAELNRVFGLKRSTLTSILDRLEERRLISRTVNPADRRSWLVQIQPAGADIARRLRSVLEEFEAEIIGLLGQEDLRSFNRVMETIARVTAVELRDRS